MAIAIYLAAPLFNERERSFNAELAEALGRYSNVFLPQRDGSLLTDMILAGVPKIVAERRVFEQDIQAMRGADLLLAVLDGSHVDEGVAFEIGYMSALGRLCIGLQTDVRRALPTGNNPMIQHGLSIILGGAAEAVDWIRAYANSHVSRSPLRA